MKYTIKVEFDTDKVLSAEEMEAIQDTVALQIEEPQDLTGNEAEFMTSNIEVTIDSKEEK
jgi:hypothetical protein